jgi:HlyD family secretion protein
MEASPSRNPQGPRPLLSSPPGASRPSSRPVRWRRRLFLLGVAIVVLAGAGIAWEVHGRTPPIEYRTAPVSRGDVTRTVTATGSVNPETTVQVGSYVSGIIQSVSCDFNTQVRKGQVCAKIDPRPYETTIAQERANVTAAQAQLAKDQTNLGLTQRAYQRSQALAAQQLLSQDQLDTAEAAAKQAQAQVDLDKSSVQQRQAALSAAQVNLGYTNIVSPVDGTVVSRDVTVGQTVAASFQTPTLFVIATDLTRMQVDANVTESDIGGIKQGADASFTVAAFPDRRFTGTVKQVRQAPQTVQNVVTYDVVVSVPNPDLLLKPGMTANIHMDTGTRTNVLRVPNEALRYQPGGLHGAAPGPSPQEPAAADDTDTEEGAASQVYVLRNGQPDPVPVVTGLQGDTDTEIVQGRIQPGDRVVTAEQTGASAGRASTGPRPFRF